VRPQRRAAAAGRQQSTKAGGGFTPALGKKCIGGAINKKKLLEKYVLKNALEKNPRGGEAGRPAAAGGRAALGHAHPALTRWPRRRRRRPIGGGAFGAAIHKEAAGVGRK